ncbi:MAG: hypothetical protein MHM6MM_003775 [Cercozoa sp. M6MM]
MVMSIYAMGRGRRAAKKQESQEDGGDRKTVGAIRVQIDLDELECPSNCRLELPNPDDMLHFRLQIDVQSGYWKGATYTFNFDVPEMYPHKAPKVTCLERIYHPNIDLEGNVCLNLLREDWRPILTVQQILHGLIFLFLEPNGNDPLNHDAARVMRENEALFRRNVNTSLRGGTVDGMRFPRQL